MHRSPIDRAGNVASCDATLALVLTARAPFYRVGADFSFNYRTFNLFGQFLYGRDQNLLPLLPPGAALPSGFITGSAAHFSRGFVEADYRAYPWMMAIGRWDCVNSAADQLNGVGADANNPARGPFLSQFGAEPIHAGNSISDSREHQDCVRVPDPAATDCL